MGNFSKSDVGKLRYWPLKGEPEDNGVYKITGVVDTKLEIVSEKMLWMEKGYRQLGPDDILQAGDETTCLSTFWEEGWDKIDGHWNYGETVEQSLKNDRDASERIFRRKIEAEVDEQEYPQPWSCKDTEWLKKKAEEEDKCQSVNVGPLCETVEVGPLDIGKAFTDAFFGKGPFKKK